MIPQAEYDVHHYLTSPPVGNIECEEAAKIFDDKLTIMAAVDPLVQSTGKSDDVKKDLMKLLKVASTCKSFVVMSALKPDIPEENIRVIQNTLAKYGKYPIKL
jgi:hypothetical protein